MTQPQSANGGDPQAAGGGQYMPPNTGYQGQGAPPQYGYAQPAPQPEPKKKKKWPWILGGVVAVVIIASVAGGGGDGGTGGVSGGGDTNQAQEQEQSGPVQMGESIDIDGLLITVDGVRPGSNPLGETFVTVDVTLENTSDKPKDFSSMDFKMERPDGVITDISFMGENSLETAKVAPGGTATGTVSFEGDGAPGEYKVTYEKWLGFSDSGDSGWVGTM